MKARSAARAMIVSVLALATIPVLVPGVAHATTTAVNCPGDDLQTAITAATAGDTLDVTGHCIGHFTINKDLTLQGDGTAVLDGTGTVGNALVIPGTPTVGLSELKVTGGNFNIGSGIWMPNAPHVTLTGVTVSGNQASSSLSAAGGGIYFHDGTLSVVDSTISGNTVTVGDSSPPGTIVSADGGGIHSDLGALSLVDSTVSGNTVTSGAGAILPSIATGGGLLINGGSATVVHSTVSGNAVSTGAGGATDALGGGIDHVTGALSVTASIISGNTVSAATANGPDCLGSLPSGGYNLVGNTTNCSGLAATDLLNVNPDLDTLKDNGGPTQTMGLLPGSPAIGAIPLSAGACVAGSATDQRGVARPQGKGCDIGALEKGRTLTTVGSSPNPAGIGQAISFTATVCANPSTLPATPTGTVTFRDGGGGPALGAAVGLAPGGGTHCAQAQLPFSGFGTNGKHAIVAIYSGDGVNTKSRGSVIQRVRP